MEKNIDIKKRPANLPEIENVDEKIAEIRSFMAKKFEENKELYDQSDMDRIDEDWTIERFLRRKRGNVQEACEMLDNTLKWRHEIEMPRMKDSDFPEEFFKIGAMFCYAPDKQGNGTVFMRVRLHRKIKEMDRPIKQFIMHQINKMDMQTNGHGMVVVFDLTGAGVSNLDMDMLWFLVSSLLNYYPYGMSYILVYNLPWIFSSAWNIVKGWLPADTRGKIKFASKDEIFNYFDKENLPLYMGGTCKINYHHIPKECRPAVEHVEERGLPQKEISKIVKQFQPFLDEADEEIKQLAMA